jgi:hypothetical protein
MTAIRSRVRRKRRGRPWLQSARKRACWSQTELAVRINLRQGVAAASRVLGPGVRECAQVLTHTEYDKGAWK